VRDRSLIINVSSKSELLQKRRHLQYTGHNAASNDSLKSVVPAELTDPEIPRETAEPTCHQSTDVPKSQGEGYVADPPGKRNASQPVITSSERVCHKSAKLDDHVC
jgi:hypothetical protein